MLLVLLVLVLLAAALVVPAGLEALHSRRGPAPRRARSPRAQRERGTLVDPGRERRAEQRARELLRSCVNAEEWAMYRDLGFIRVFGRSAAPRTEARPGASPAAAAEEPVSEPTVAEDGEPSGGTDAPAPGRSEGAGRGPGQNLPAGASPGARGPGYAYLLYAHKPILAYEPETYRLLSEYCVEFPDLSDAVTGSRLPDSDDVLAKWMALTGDEPRLLRDANMHLPGRQLDPGRVRRDLWRLGEWERRRRSADASSR